MKKLKCEECGGHLTIDPDKEYATCQYCKTKYKLNDDKTIVIKMDDDKRIKATPLTPEQQKHLDKTMGTIAYVIIAIALLIIISVVFIMSRIISRQLNTSNYNIDYFNTQNIEK